MRKNLFGDITAVYKGNTKVAEYTYDAWGNCKIELDMSGYATRNPFRYRGYYFDNDLGMYYLLTRYYDPKTGRFINADSTEYLDPNAINGLNLYAYCKNNPIMYFDPSGCFLIMLGMISFFVMAVIGVTATFVAAAIDVAIVLTDIFNIIVEASRKFIENNNMDLEDVDRVFGSENNGSQDSSRVKILYERFGGPGEELTNAIKEEYGIPLD